MIRAAALLVNGEVWTLPRPCRHHTLVQAWVSAHYPLRSIPEHDQGFVTDQGVFVGRETAAQLAHECGQIPEPKHTLFSEDLW